MAVCHFLRGDRGPRTIRSRGSQDAALGARKKQSSLHGEVRGPLEAGRASELQVGAERHRLANERVLLPMLYRGAEAAAHLWRELAARKRG